MEEYCCNISSYGMSLSNTLNKKQELCASYVYNFVVSET